jgi:uncharacterized repeat protein (TIGR03803 family)
MESKTQDQRYRSLISLASATRWRAATAPLALAAVLAAGLIATPLAQAQTLTTLHSFDATDGYYVEAGLVQGTNGNLYGTTGYGGTDYEGTVFDITTSGTLTTLHDFCSQTGCTDGNAPTSALVQAPDGNFYGTTYQGGTNGRGNFFKISPGGTLTTLYNFCSQSRCPDGYFPLATLVYATDGNFYGTTGDGGANARGTVFKITTSGTLTTLYSFCSQSGCTDGAYPGQSALIQAADGNFYGTTGEGGAHNASGTFFRITPGGALTTLYSFCSQSNCTDGGYPNGLVQASDGNFYGTTESLGADYGGTVFKITPSGALTTLHSFCSESNCADGDLPYSALIQATDGNLYGTTYFGGANDSCVLYGYSYTCGTLFEITPSGTLTTLYSFGGTDGFAPEGRLLQDTNGTFYGTTFYGGTGPCEGACGTVFSLSVGLGPFVEPQTAFGNVGSLVKILGTDLAGATSVTFNGTSAVFTIESKSAIAATVPAGATSGTVEVTLPFGTLKSNVPFRVQP